MWIQSNFMFLILLEQIQVLSRLYHKKHTQIWSRRIALESTSNIRSRPIYFQIYKYK
jgi:hypothetical protein